VSSNGKRMKVLVLNCGSSSVKYQLFDMPEGTVLAKGGVQRIGESMSEAVQQAGTRQIKLSEKVADHDQSLRVITRMLTDPDKGAIGSLTEIGACGHRVVHGGEEVTGSALIDDKLETIVKDLFELAPLHNPPNLTGIRAARNALGAIPQVACFDTAFHQTIRPVAYLYGLPYEMYEKHRVRRYGFHGTSHRYVARRAAELMGRHKYGVNLITCHLGNGCSITAIREGRSVDTSMGLTPLEGVVMGTRTGDLDPAIVFYLLRRGFTIEQLDSVFNKKSGLLGISRLSNDMRDLEEKAAAGEDRATLALEVFAYRVRKYIGAYLAVLNGCDAVVFTGGIGENAVVMRRRILTGLDQLGITLDEAKNRDTVHREGRIDAGSRIAVWVIPTDEEKAIARDTYILATGSKA
jgi:acetate kinase